MIIILEHTQIAKNFYKSSPWTRTRNAYFKSKFGLCERCGESAHIVYHKVYINNINKPDVTLNWDNLETVCQDCHNKEHFKQKAVIDGCWFNEDSQLRYSGE